MELVRDFLPQHHAIFQPARLQHFHNTNKNDGPLSTIAPPCQWVLATAIQSPTLSPVQRVPVFRILVDLSHFIRPKVFIYKDIKLSKSIFPESGKPD